MLGAVLGVTGVPALVAGIVVWSSRRSKVRRAQIEKNRATNVPRVLKHSSKEYQGLNDVGRETWKPLPELHTTSTTHRAELL